MHHRDADMYDIDTDKQTDTDLDVDAEILRVPEKF